MRTIVVPEKGEEISGLRQEKLAILLKCKDTLLENMRLTDTNIHLKAEIDRLKIIIEFLMKRITKCRCHTR
jgi:hypothetical protein